MGIYIDEAGFITRSMVTNCSAYQGAGVYLNGDANNSEIRRGASEMMELLF